MMKIDSALTFAVICGLTPMQLAKIVTGPYCAEDKLKAANGLKMKVNSLNYTRTKDWLSLSIEDKNTLREALSFDTTAEGFSAIN